MIDVVATSLGCGLRTYIKGVIHSVCDSIIVRRTYASRLS